LDENTVLEETLHNEDPHEKELSTIFWILIIIRGFHFNGTILKPMCLLLKALMLWFSYAEY